ncbi:amidase [Nocardioides sp. YIM 152588]|uniref:amidase n=1 Tax=Nocardioides sp. YIM 152588 TaxID=3158259 RepID=UPI0032E512E4
MSLVAELAALDATAQAALVHRGELRPRDLVAAAIERIEGVDPALNAVITPAFDAALEAAERVQPDAHFAGVPFLVKDLAAQVEGVAFHEGSRFLRDVVSTHDTELVRRLRASGLVILGKTNAPEFGMVPACEPLLSGPTRNPWDVDRSTSGSSGGSAAAVASGMVPMAHGNDLGGSLRYPASACGVFGLKPTRARVPVGPEFGDLVGGWACEHALTRSVRDSAGLLDALAGRMVGDPYPAPPHAGTFAGEVGLEPPPLRIGFSGRRFDGRRPHPDCVAALEDAVALCADLGHEPVEANLPGLTAEVGAAIGTVLDAAIAWVVAHWTRKLGRPPEGDDLEPLTWAYLEAGRKVSAADYLEAVEVLQRFARRVAEFLAGVDVWLTPTLSDLPAPIGAITSTAEDPLRALRNGGRTTAYAGVVANITGNPAMSVPLWWNDADGLPVGVHFLGRYGDEATLFRLAGQMEAARPWSGRRPPVWAG